MVVSGKVTLVYGTILLAPVCELDEAILLGDLGHRAYDGVAYACQLAEAFI